MLPVEFFRQPWLGGLSKGERAGTDNQVGGGGGGGGCWAVHSPRSSEDILENRGGRAGVSLPPVQPRRALLAMAECPVCPQPSRAAAQLTSQSQAALISRLLPSRSSSSLLDQMSRVLAPKIHTHGGEGTDIGEAVSLSREDVRPAGNN